VLLRRCVEVRGRLLGTRSEECGDNGSRCSPARAAAVAAWRTAPGDGHNCPHAQELITFSRGGKTDWGKKCRIFEDLFQPRINWIDTDMGKAGFDMINKMNKMKVIGRERAQRSQR